MPAPKDPIKYAEYCKHISESNKGEKNWTFGKHLSEDHRKKLSDAHKGKPQSENQRLAIMKALKGHTVSEETRMKISNAQKGRKLTPDRCKQNSECHKGLHHTEETRKKMSESAKGKVRTLEHCLNIGKAQKGKKISEERRIKQSIAQNKRFENPEEREKMRVAKLGKMGAMACNWQGGKSFEPYCVKFNREFKERVRAFFGYQCQECGHIWHEGEDKLAVHHVNFRKDSCCAEDVIPLFVPLCHGRCHGKTHHNRIFWEYWFTEMINRLYGGKCYLSRKQ